MLHSVKNEFLTNVVSSGRVTVPRPVRMSLGLVEGDIVRVFVESVENGTIEKSRCYTEPKTKTHFEKDTGVEAELLWALLWGNGHTVLHVAKMFACGATTVREGMHTYGIPEPDVQHEEQRHETLRECGRRRRLKKSLLLEDFTREEWLEKVELTEGICPFCGRPYDEGGGLTLDHDMPISKAPPGFCYTIDDVNPMCRSCNTRKLDSIVF